MTATMTTRQAREADPLMDALVTTKARINVGIVQLQYSRPGTTRWDKVRARLIRIFTHDYLPVLAEMQAGSDRRQLHRRRMEVKRRLYRGWRMEPFDDQARQNRADELFAELLWHYEILTDCLRLEHPNREKRPLNVLFDRIDRIAGTLVPEREA